MTPLASLKNTSMTLNKGSMFLRFFIFSMLLSQFSACSLLSQESNGIKGNVIKRVMPILPVPSELQQKVWLEKFTFSFISQGGKAKDTKASEESANKVSRYAKQSMLLQTELTEQGISIAAMSFDGIPLAQASWQKGSQAVKSELTVAKSFDAKQVLHDLQIVNWPIKYIAPALAGGVSVDEQIVADESTGRKNKIRRFYHQGEVIIIIHYQEKAINFEQLSLGYQLNITRLNDSDLKVAESHNRTKDR